MEEIAENVFIEESYPRVVLGVLKLDHGLLVVDSPFRLKDVSSWQSKLSHMGGGVERLLVLLDAHIDRSMTIWAMETNVLSHENGVEIIHDRSAASKNQDLEPGTDWTHTEFPVGFRCFTPQMTFSEEVLIYWDEKPIVVSHKTGAHTAGAWVVDDAKKVVFIGDSVVMEQPPFLAMADLDTWITELSWLQTDRFKNFKIVSSRNGVIKMDSVRKMADFLSKTKDLVDDLAQEDAPLEGIPELASQLLMKIDYDIQYHERYLKRLTWGLDQTIKRHFLEQETETKGEGE